MIRGQGEVGTYADTTGAGFSFSPSRAWQIPPWLTHGLRRVAAGTLAPLVAEHLVWNAGCGAPSGACGMWKAECASTGAYPSD